MTAVDHVDALGWPRTDYQAGAQIWEGPGLLRLVQLQGRIWLRDMSTGSATEDPTPEQVDALVMEASHEH